MRINVDMNQLIQNASFIQGQAEEYAEVYGSVYQLLLTPLEMLNQM